MSIPSGTRTRAHSRRNSSGLSTCSIVSNETTNRSIDRAGGSPGHHRLGRPGRTFAVHVRRPRVRRRSRPRSSPGPGESRRSVALAACNIKHPFAANEVLREAITSEVLPEYPGMGVLGHHALGVVDGTLRATHADRSRMIDPALLPEKLKKAGFNLPCKRMASVPETGMIRTNPRRVYFFMTRIRWRGREIVMKHVHLFARFSGQPDQSECSNRLFPGGRCGGTIHCLTPPGSWSSRSSWALQSAPVPDHTPGQSVQADRPDESSAAMRQVYLRGTMILVAEGPSEATVAAARPSDPASLDGNRRLFCR